MSRFNCDFEFAYPVRKDDKLDFVGAPSNALIVSGRVRDCVEALEPCVHQFLPCDLVHVPSTLRNRKDLNYSVLNCCARLDFIDVVASGLIRRESPLGLGPRFTPLTRWPDLIAKSGWTPSGHLWMSIESVMGGQLFISDSLKERLEAAGAGPARFQYVKLS